MASATIDISHLPRNDFMCPHDSCLVSFFNKDQFFDHWSAHGGCPKCSVQSGKRYNFRVHWMRVHREDFPNGFPGLAKEFKDCQACGEKSLLDVDGYNHVRKKGHPKRLAHLVPASQWVSNQNEETHSELAGVSTLALCHPPSATVSNPARDPYTMNDTDLSRGTNLSVLYVGSNLALGNSFFDMSNPELFTPSLLNATLSWDPNSASGMDEAMLPSSSAAESHHPIEDRISELSDIDHIDPAMSLDCSLGGGFTNNYLTQHPKRAFYSEDQTTAHPPRRIKLAHTSTADRSAGEKSTQGVPSPLRNDSLHTDSHRVSEAVIANAHDNTHFQISRATLVKTYRIQSQTYSFERSGCKTSLKSSLIIAIKSSRAGTHRGNTDGLHGWIRKVKTISSKSQSDTRRVFNIKDTLNCVGSGPRMKTSSYYRMIDDNSKAFDFCKFGNYNDLNKMLSIGEVTLYDVNSDGQTLLHVAAEFAQPEICQLLLEKNADIVSARDWTIFQRTPFGYVCNPKQKRALVDACRIPETLRILLKHGHDIIISHEVDADIFKLCNSATALESQVLYRAAAAMFRDYLQTSSCNGLFHEPDTHENTQQLLFWWNGEILPVLQYQEFDREDQTFDVLSNNSLRTLQTYLLREIISVQTNNYIYAPTDFTSSMLHKLGDLNYRVPFQYQNEYFEEISPLELASQSIASWTYFQGLLENADVCWSTLIGGELNSPYCTWSATFLMNLSSINADEYIDSLQEQCPKLEEWFHEPFERLSLDTVFGWQEVVSSLKKGCSFDSVDETIMQNLMRFNQVLEQEEELNDDDSDTSNTSGDHSDRSDDTDDRESERREEREQYDDDGDGRDFDVIQWDGGLGLNDDMDFGFML